MHERLRLIGSQIVFFLLLTTIPATIPDPSQAAARDQAAVIQRHAEDFVINQLSNGDEADLGDLHDPSRQVLSAAFVEDLLTGKLDGRLKKKRGIAILNARVDGDLILSQADVHYAVSLNNCTFSGLVDLSGAHFFHDLSFLHSRFNKNVHAGQLRVDGDLTLRWSQFTGEVDFAATTVGGSLYAGGIESLKAGEEVEFDYAKVATITEFSNLKLAGPLRLTGADLQILLLRRDHYLASEDPSSDVKDQISLIDLEGTIIHRDFELEAKVIETLSAPALEVLGKTLIQEVKITGEVNFEGAHFDDLAFGDDVYWPQAVSSNRLSGITFSRLSLGLTRQCSTEAKCVDSRWRWLLDGWVDHSEYSPQAYQQLETAYNNAGRATLGDDTFEKMKHREREDGHLTPLDWLANGLEEWVIGYGREPQYALLWCIPIVAFGYLIFRPKYMRKVKPDDKPLPYNAFWYSFELFLPLVKLQCAELWVPYDHDRARITYMRVHSMFGWILVPFALAALTGLVHGK